MGWRLARHLKTSGEIDHHRALVAREIDLNPAFRRVVRKIRDREATQRIHECRPRADPMSDDKP